MRYAISYGHGIKILIGYQTHLGGEQSCQQMFSLPGALGAIYSGISLVDQYIKIRLVG